MSHRENEWPFDALQERTEIEEIALRDWSFVHFPIMEQAILESDGDS